MTSEGAGDRRGNPRIYELVENAPREGPSTLWAWPQLIEYVKVASQPVQGPWPPHQEPRPDPTDETLPVAVPDPQSGRKDSPDPQSTSPFADLTPDGPEIA